MNTIDPFAMFTVEHPELGDEMLDKRAVTLTKQMLRTWNVDYHECYTYDEGRWLSTFVVRNPATASLFGIQLNTSHYILVDANQCAHRVNPRTGEATMKGRMIRCSKERAETCSSYVYDVSNECYYVYTGVSSHVD